MANSNWANITWSHNYSAGTDFVVKYITSKHQIAWGLYRVVMPLEILPAPTVAAYYSVLITACGMMLYGHAEDGRGKGRSRSWLCRANPGAPQAIPSPCTDAHEMFMKQMSEAVHL